MRDVGNIQCTSNKEFLNIILLTSYNPLLVCFWSFCGYLFDKWSAPVISNEGKGCCSRKKQEPLMGFKLTLERHPLNHGPTNHGLATPFLSYRVTLNSHKTQDFIWYLIIWQAYKLSPPHRRFHSYKVFICAIFNSHITWWFFLVIFVLPLVRQFFWVIIILHRRLHWGLVLLK